MHIIVGLGNPGKEYENTRHNVGFCVIDELAKRYGASVTKSKNKALVGECVTPHGERIVLAKPQTYMNLSGESIAGLMGWYKLDRANIIVVYDDISLAVGTLRIRTKGSAGGHNGIKSTIQHVGSDEFCRIKLGVGAPDGGRGLVSHVLGKFQKDEMMTIEQTISRACDAVQEILRSGAAAAMNLYN